MHQRRIAMAAALLVIVGTVPFRAEPLPNEVVTLGVGDWERDDQGERVRWTRDYATIIVPSQANSVELALRAPQPAAIDFAVDGGEVLTIRLDNAWRTVRLALPPALVETQYRRVDLRAYPTSAQASRVLGVQLGEIVVSITPRLF